MKNQYLVFGWYHYEQSGGAEDCIGAASTLNEAKALALKLRKDSLTIHPAPYAPTQLNYLQVFDVATLEMYYYDAPDNEWYSREDMYQLRARREAGVSNDRKVLNI